VDAFEKSVRAIVWLVLVTVILLVTLTCGSMIGSALEWTIRGTPSFLYHLPSNCLAFFAGCAKLLWIAITNPLRTACTLLGMLITLVLLLLFSNFFSDQPQVLRGSRIRSGDRVLQEREEDGFNPPRKPIQFPNPFQANRLFGADGDSEQQHTPYWKVLLWKIQSLLNRK